MPKKKIDIPQELPILLVRDMVLYPEMTAPIQMGDAANIQLILDVPEEGGFIGVVTTKTPETPNDFYEIGTVAEIQKTQPMPPQYLRVLITGISRFKIVEIFKDGNLPYLMARIELLPDQTDADPNKTEILMESVLSFYREFLNKLNPENKEQLENKAMESKNPARVSYLTIGSLPDWVMSIEEKQKFLENRGIQKRLKEAAFILQKAILRLDVQDDLREKFDKLHKDIIIREQIEILRRELGEGPGEVEKYKEKIAQAKMPPEAEKAAREILERLSRLPAQAAEYSYLETWLDLMTSLPWSKSTEDQLDIKEAEKILEEDHYGLERVKNRILEFLAVKKLNPQGKGSILCFMGPPGTGKTSVGKSIARAMNRKFIRISLGGVYDESQIRGHRRTYVGALPGVIIQELQKAGSNNPVFMIDEIDKIGTSTLHGDPSSALLEALDPEHNFVFSDHYLGTPFNLSKIMFICTGNLADFVEPALRDRMEILDFPGYTREEKLMIAKNYLVPRQLEANGLSKNQLKFEDKALQSIISNYTKEAGVRNLEKEIGNACRKIVTGVARGDISKEHITEKKLPEILGPRKFISQLKERISRPGVATGLAWTQLGGEILFIETEMIRGIKRPDLEITGNIEKIMEESAIAALTFVEANLEMLGIPKTRSPVGNKVHIHVPEAAVPKDGPSAGIAIFVALVSLLTKRKSHNDIAMTGEITLRGVVLPVGGIKEKVLAAKEAGIKTIILPKENEKDLQDLPKSVKKALAKGEIEIKFISEMKEALEIALLPKS